MIRVGIIGISGFGGKVLLDILLRHVDVRVTYVAAHTSTGRVDALWPEFRGRTDLVCVPYNPADAISRCDLVFLALPHTQSMALAGPLLEAGKKVIDLSADYRLRNPVTYKTWYHTQHTDRKNIARAVYGLPEIYRERIRKARLIANPGCYPTSVILGLAPLLAACGADVTGVIIDAKSGVSGAGRKVAEGLMYCFVNENFKAYRVLNHQHTPEIAQGLSRIAGKPISPVFVPHLLPLNVGILSTMYVSLSRKLSASRVAAIYQKFFKAEPFVRVLPPGEQPETRHVAGTNYCDIACVPDAKGRTLVVTSAIDNLVKGAAGQAVQNMNIMYQIPEERGLL